MTVPPGELDPREFALQLAVVSERMDERSALAAERMEQASLHLEQRANAAVKHLAAQCERVADVHRAATEARTRMLWILSAGMLAGALVASAVATFAVGSARRDLAVIERDQTLLQAINRADLTLCGGRLCARLAGEGQGAANYQPVALRPPDANAR